MKRRLCRALATLTMITVMLFFASACGGTTDTTSEETLHETEEESVESEESETETEDAESETETEDTDDVVTDGEYVLYPAFIKTFEINDNVLKVETGDVFEDFEIPTEMAINFEYPLATDIAWIDNVTKVTDEDDWYAWFEFSLEGIAKAAQRYNDGQYEGTYTSGEDFCKEHPVWTFVIEDETVQSISMDLVEVEETEAVNATETSTETSAPSASAKEETIAPVAPTAPAHTHNYNGTVTKEATCASNGVKTFVCSCGDSYEEITAANGNHNWVEIYGTVEHPSQGEMRQVQVGTSGEIVVCNYCGAEFSSSDEAYNHRATYAQPDNLNREHGMAGTTFRPGGAIYENQWVVTQEAWTETVVTGYQCSICGATK